jgi:two-component system sensor histidine kinase CpxA
MNVRFPLSARILLWFLLNLVFLALVFCVFLGVQFPLDSLLVGRAGDRIQSVANLLSVELNQSPRTQWDGILKQFGDAYHVQFLVFRNDGRQVAGETTKLPDIVATRLEQGRGGPPGQPLPREAGLEPRPDDNLGPPPQGAPGPDDNAGPPPGAEPPPGPDGRPPPREGRPDVQADTTSPAPAHGPGVRPGGPPPGAPVRFMVHTRNPSLYWVGVRIRVVDRDRPRPAPLTMLAVSDSIRGGGLFLDLLPWIVVGFGCVLVSVLFWLPLVRGITHSISQITSATGQIADGRFDARVAVRRTDELGSLGHAINQMAARLAGFVTGQKRFLGDISHELCSPIARIQVALGILEQRADDTQKTYLADLREEVDLMSNLVNELLSFSKASLGPASIRLQPVALRETVEKAVHRENVAGADIRIEVDNSLRVLAEPELLLRCLANLVRNAIRYAGKAGPITISARREDTGIVLSVADNGPGVPEASLAQLFDPFYRTELSRTRETGGVGLGLAIVKTCVESCQGTVKCRNRQPTGLEVLITLLPA